MRFPKLLPCLLLAAAALAFQGTTAREASAQDAQLTPRTYKVQVEYWFFDTDYYYWSTYFESDNYNDAKLVYDLLMHAKQDGQLNEVAANSYWRYIAVDVRLITVYHLPQLNLRPALSPIRKSLFSTR